MKRRILLTLVIPTVSALGCFPTKVASQYSNAAEIESARLQGRNIPEELPQSTFFVQDMNDVDYDRTWGAFQFRPGDGLNKKSDTVVEALLPEDVNSSFASFPGTKWWPPFLGGRFIAYLDERAAAESGFAFYKTRRFYLCISPSQGMGYFWRSRDRGPFPQ